MPDTYGIKVTNASDHVVLTNQAEGHYYYGTASYETEIKRTTRGFKELTSIPQLNNSLLYVDAVRQCRLYIDVPAGAVPQTFLKNIPLEYQTIIPPTSFVNNGATDRWTFIVMTTSLTINPIVHVFLNFTKLNRNLFYFEESKFGIKTYNDNNVVNNDTRYSKLSLLVTGVQSIDPNNIIVGNYTELPVRHYYNLYRPVVSDFATRASGTITQLNIDGNIDSNDLLIYSPCTGHACFVNETFIAVGNQFSRWQFVILLLPCIGITSDKQLEIKWFAYDYGLNGDFRATYSSWFSGTKTTTITTRQTPYYNKVKNADSLFYMVADLNNYR